MKRRAYLAAAGAAGLAGLSGCKGEVAPGVGRQLLGPDTDRRRVTVADVDAPPDGASIALTVEAVQTTANADHPARIRLEATNLGSKRAIAVGTGECCLFNRAKGGSDDPAGLWLYRPGSWLEPERTGERWVREDRGPRSYPLYGCSPPTYGPGTSVTNEYEVWDDHRVRGYFAPGTYRWEEVIELYDDTRADFTDDPDTAFTWGFSLDVMVPE